MAVTKFAPLSKKAQDALTNSDHRINMFVGAVRASKTFISVIRWINFITTEVQDGQLLCVCGKSVATIERNIIAEIIKIVGRENVKYSRNKGELIVLGKMHMVCGVNDEAAKDKIHGATLMGALCDEAALYPKSFIDMLLTRFSYKGAKTFWTMNPENSGHYMKTEFIDREDEINLGEDGTIGKRIKVFTFTIDDNLSLDDEYKQSLKNSLRGVYYDRLVKGLWCSADGLVFDMFRDRDIIDTSTESKTYGEIMEYSHVVDVNQLLIDARRTRFRHYIIGIDYGTSNACTFV